MSSPARQVIENDVKRAKIAAPRAGTTCSGRFTVSICVTAPARIPMPPATAAASTAFWSARRSVCRPASFALVPFSEAARVASPKCDQRYSAHSTAAASTTMPVSQNRSAGIRAPNMVTRPCGSTDGMIWLPPPPIITSSADGALSLPPPLRMRSIVACAVSSTPSDATSDDSGEELRSGRKTTVSTTTPKTTVPASARTSATAVATPSEVSHRNRYAATIELAPVARLMTPDPR